MAPSPSAASCLIFRSWIGRVRLWRSPNRSAQLDKRRTPMVVKTGWEGRYFEDFEVGDIYRCRLGRTVTEADNIWFTLLTNNTNQIHFNNEFGKKTEFGKCLIN